MKKFLSILMFVMLGYVVFGLAISMLFSVQLGSIGDIMFKTSLFAMLPTIAIAMMMQDKKDSKDNYAWMD